MVELADTPDLESGAEICVRVQISPEVLWTIFRQNDNKRFCTSCDVYNIGKGSNPNLSTIYRGMAVGFARKGS